MNSIFSRWFSSQVEVEPLEPGLYHYLASDEAVIPYRLHLRIEEDGSGILIVNAATVLHLNPTAAEHAYHVVKNHSAEIAAATIANRYRVSKSKAREDFDLLRQKILALATNPDVDPVLFLDIDRTKPFETRPTAPYRMDLALTYQTDPDGALDPMARARVDRELTTEEWQTVLSKAWEAGVPHVTFTGGEPTRRPDLVELVTFAEKLGQVTGVLTDGRRLSDPQRVEALSQAGLDHFLITIDPDDERSWAGFTNALGSDVFTAAHLTLTPQLLPHLFKWLERFENMGLRAISLSASDKSEKMIEALEEARERTANLGIDLLWDLPVPYSKNNPIALEVEESSEGAERAWIYVEPDGDVLPEQGVDRIMGNMLTDPWSEIWGESEGSQ